MSARIAVLLSLLSLSARAEDPLVADARRGFILSWARARGTDGARPALAELCRGDAKLLRKSLAQLADAYDDIGRFRDAATVWRDLVNEAPRAPDSAMFQARILWVVTLEGNRQRTVEQAVAMAQTLHDAEQQTGPDDPTLAGAMELAERELSLLAVTWHRERPDFDVEAANRATDAIYQTYLRLFPTGDKSYQLRFFRAELAFNELRDYRLAAQLYTDVFNEDIARKNADPGAKPGKFMELAAYDAILALDELAKGT